MSEWLDAEERVERAQQLSEAQQWTAALEELEAALAINPHHPIWHAHRGYLLEELERGKEAVAAYKTALELDPSDPEVALALGAALMRLERFGEALEVLNALSHRRPDFEPAYCHRLAIYAELGEHDRAEEMFYLGQQLEDRCPHCFFHLGSSLAARQQFDRAIFCWKRVLEIFPEYPGVNRLIARVYRAQREFSLSREHYLKELRSEPGDTDLLYELAILSLESGQFAKAGARLVQMLELDPEHVEARYALGRVLLLRGRPQAALKCFEKVAATKHDYPSLPGFYARFGEALFRLGRFVEARSTLQAALHSDPEDLTAREMFADCLVKMGKDTAAADALRRILATDGDHASARAKLGACLFRQGQTDAGRDHALQALQVRSNDPLATDVAIRASIQLGRWHDARIILRHVLKRDPTNRAYRRLSRRLPALRVACVVQRLTRGFARVFGRTVG